MSLIGAGLFRVIAGFNFNRIVNGTGLLTIMPNKMDGVKKLYLYLIDLILMI